jgi:hypothetical protein
VALKNKIPSIRTVTTYTLAGAAGIALAIGGAAIANSGSSNGVSTNASTMTWPKVIPFDRGHPSPATKVGKVPASFHAGAGKLITGTAGKKAKAAALAAFPGGKVNRVVKLSDGEYNVHVIAVNWPHHIFVNKNFKVVGAD